jgi:hypothetical protein
MHGGHRVDALCLFFPPRAAWSSSARTADWGSGVVMQIRNLLLAFGGAVLALASIKPASATTMDYTLNFAATGFGSDAPVPFVLGQLSFSLDTATSSSGSVSIDFLNLSMGSLSYIYSSDIDYLSIGADTNGGILGIGTNSDDMY